MEEGSERVRSFERAGGIVLVEDNFGDVGLVRSALVEHGIKSQLTVFRDGQEALEFIDQVDTGSSSCPDLVILDLNLPKVNGREVLKRIRLSPVFGDIPVVILSSSDAGKDRQETAALGASRYIRKPSTLDDFLKIGGTLKAFLP
jgi:chemotaxis family two-component system response regulator Rcp1